MLLLEHNGASNGTILATFEKNVNRGDAAVFPIYRSVDGGKTWEHYSDIPDMKGYGGNRWQQMLYELPNAIGDMPAGTILCAGNAVPEDFSKTNIVLYKSSDGGKNWEYVSTIAQGGKVALNENTAVWEPFLLTIGDKLVCYFSDERELKSNGYSQFLGHVYSTDGGKSWSKEVKDVGVADKDTRPGMAVVNKLGNGKYLMTYEVVSWLNNVPGEKNFPVHFKLSDDGLNWGSAADIGKKIQTEDGLFLGSTPYSVYSAASGDKGMIIVSARGYRDDNSTKSSSDYLVNYNYGEGPWHRMPMAITHDDSTPTAGYSRSMIVLADHKNLLEMAPVKIPGYLNDRMEIRYAAMPLNGIRYEAEDALLLGNAVIGSEHKSSSGGKKVGMLDNIGDGVDFTVKVDQPGAYTIRLRYADGWGKPAQLKATVNNQDHLDLNLPTTLDWPIYDYVTFSAQLEAGENHIRFEHENNYAELDCIEVYPHEGSMTKSETKEINVKGNADETGIESEDGVLRMIADTVPAGNPVKWSVWDADGQPTDCAQINEEGVLKALKNGVVQVVASDIENTAIKGQTTIMISGQVKKERYEAEKGAIKGDQTKIVKSSAASGGEKVGWLNIPGRDTVTIVIHKETGGEYILQERYSNGLKDAKHNVMVNGKSFKVALPVTGGWDTYKSSEGVAVDLKDGDNTITISPLSDFAELDCIELSRPEEQ